MANHPAEELDGILKASGLRDYLDLQRAFALAGADAYREAQYTLKTGIRDYLRSRGEGMMAGSKANRIVKPLARAASYHELAAKQFGLVWQYYNGVMIPATNKAGEKHFDPTA